MKRNGDAETKAGQQEERIGGHPAETGRAKETTRGALMVVGTMQAARELATQMGMADLKWLQEGEFVQRAEFTEWPRSRQLELAIAASTAREWVTAKTPSNLRWRFDVPRRRQSQEHHRWPPTYDARPSMAPQRGADGSSSKENPWRHPLPQTVRPSTSSQEELRNLIKTEVASLLAPYERFLEEAKTTIAGRDAEIASLKQELAAVKAQAKSSAVPADELPPPDPRYQQGKQEWREMQRSVREMTKEFKEAVQQCKTVRMVHDRRDNDFAVLQVDVFRLEQQFKEELKLRAGGVHSLSEPLKEKEQNQQPEGKQLSTGWTSSADRVLAPELKWPTLAKGFQYEATKVSASSEVPPQAFSFQGAADHQLPACATEGSFVFQQPAPAAVTPALICTDHLKDGFVIKQAAPEAVALVSAVLEVGAKLADTPPKAAATSTSNNRQVSVGKAAAALEVRAEWADTPPKAAATSLRPRSKRQVSPGMNTPAAPAAKRGMAEDSEEEDEDGTDADIRRWMEAEHMEAEFEEVGADEEEAGRALTRQRVKLMGSEEIEEEAARARRGPLFTDENLSMGG